MKYVKIFIAFLIATEFLLVGFLAIYGERDNIIYKEQAVVVLGAGIRGYKNILPCYLRESLAVLKMWLIG